ncbi:helix-turn-helix domain-containing protein [Kribbella sp. NPDC026611]|uniref:GlxA family transcriptional regulator n=1 Tax=Kribbella sp. NPDC026611 TaxID=3154911 RepID=UPI0033E03649
MQTIAVLAYDRAPTFELSIPAEVFGTAAMRDRCRLVMQRGEPGPLRTEHGWSIPVSPAVDLAPGDLLIVAGWRDPVEKPPASMLDLVRSAAAAGVTVASLCTGAFVLAAAGLLDGRTATTHWRHAPVLARDYPLVTVDPAVLYIDAGDVLTSAGSAAGMDLCLHLVRRMYGAAPANELARQMIVAAHREGGQAQYLPQTMALATGTGAVAASTEWMAGRLDQQITVAELAARCHLSSRQYVRRFTELTGTSPYQWLLRQRIARACELLETTEAGVDEIARSCGFGDATGLRAQFRRRLGTTPTAYRGTFRQSDLR